MYVAIITVEQAISLAGMIYDIYGQVFNPVLDNDDNWVISDIEINNCLSEYDWLKLLPLIEYEPKIYSAWF